METIRGRLTLWYATALIVTLAVFAIVLYLARRGASYEDLGRRVQSEADLTAGILAESYRARGALVEADTAGRPVLISEVAAVLEVVPDYLLITSRDGRLLFASPDARAFAFAEFEQLLRLASTAPSDGGGGGARHRTGSRPTVPRSTTSSGPFPRRQARLAWSSPARTRAPRRSTCSSSCPRSPWRSSSASFRPSSSGVGSPGGPWSRWIA